MVELVKESEIIQPEETAESPESVPEDEVETVADEVEEKISWAPLTNSGVIGHLETLARNLSKIPKLEFYGNPGKTKYVCWRVKKNRGVVFCYLAVKSARIGIGEVSYKVKEDGFYQKDERVAIRVIVSEVRKFIKAKGW